MRAPQWPQYGREGSTARSHLGQTPVSPLSAAAIGLTAGTLPAEPAEPATLASAAGTGEPPVVVAPRLRATAAVIGLPQSMQNRDDASFSRPQKAQVASELTVGWGGTCEANIRGAVGLGTEAGRGAPQFSVIGFQFSASPERLPRPE